PPPMLSLLSFFLQCHAHPPYLHSFPTRRSSDLEAPPRDSGRITAGQSSSGAFSEAGSSSASRVFAAGFTLVAVARFLGFFVAASDRKSTRLNSSHVAISYAVFCLKKKKRETNEP